MSLITINVLANDAKLDQIIESQNLLILELKQMSATVEAVQAAQAAAQSALDLLTGKINGISSALVEALAELGNHNAQLAAFQAQVDALNAQIAALGAGAVIPQSLLDQAQALAAQAASLDATLAADALTKAQALAAIVPNQPAA
jgi:chromosome segregation ATPase